MTCAHHWLIEDAIGPVSKARCRKCRATRTLENSLPPVDLFKHYGEPTLITPFTARGARRPTASGAWVDGH